MSRLTPSKGFSLVEVLVALFVLSVGILGIIGLQLFAKQNNFDAIQRTTAAALATDIVERMRLNKTSLAAYAVSATPVSAQAPTTFPTTCTSAAMCSAAQIAAQDLQTWYGLINGLSDQQGIQTTGGLSVPSACIIQDPNGVGGTVGASQYRIVIAWRGQTPVSSSTRNTCGTGLGLYGTNDQYRRIFILDAKIE